MKFFYTGVLIVGVVTFSGLINAAALTADKEIKDAYAILGKLNAQETDGQGAGLPPELANIVFEYAGKPGPLLVKEITCEQEPLALGTDSAGQVVALFNDHDAVICKNIRTGKTHTISHNLGSVDAAAIGCGLTALYSRERNYVHIKDIKTGTLKTAIAAGTQYNHAINKVMMRAADTNGKPIVVTISDTKTCLWDTESGNCYREFLAKRFNSIDCACDDTGSMLFISGASIWNVAQGTPFRILGQPTSYSCLPIQSAPTIHAVALGYDAHKQLHAALATKGTIGIYTVSTGEIGHTLYCNVSVNCLALDHTKDGKLIVVAGLQENLQGENLIVWLIQPDGTIMRHAYTHGRSVTAVMITKDKEGTVSIASVAQQAPREIGDAPTHSMRIHQLDIIPGDFEKTLKKQLADEQSASTCVIL